MKYQFVTAIHGNEPMPTLALAYAGVEQIVANPEALSQGKRFLEKDMNASFGSEGNSLEEGRAKEVSKLLNKERLVVDFHTFSAESEPFAIVVDKKMIGLAQQLGVSKVVYMNHNIKKGHALINAYVGVSVEVGKHDDPGSFYRTLEVVQNLESSKKHELRLYEAVGVYDKPGKYVNFKKHVDGSYPVLAGENAYKHFGIKTRFIKKVV